MKLESWDQYEAAYSWNKLIIKGIRDTSDSFKWFFPFVDVSKGFENKIDWEYIIRSHEILRFGEPLRKHFETTAKEELEQLLSEEMAKVENKRLLISMLLNNILIFRE